MSRHTPRRARRQGHHIRRFEALHGLESRSMASESLSMFGLGLGGIAAVIRSDAYAGEAALGPARGEVDQGPGSRRAAMTRGEVEAFEVFEVRVAPPRIEAGVGTVREIVGADYPVLSQAAPTLATPPKGHHPSTMAWPPARSPDANAGGGVAASSHGGRVGDAGRGAAASNNLAAPADVTDSPPPMIQPPAARSSQGTLSSQPMMAPSPQAMTFSEESTPEATVVDDSDAGFAQTGTWNNINWGGGLNGGLRYRVGTNAPASTASWTATDLVAGTYDVQADWSGYNSRASNAQYTILVNGVAVAGATYTIDQETASWGGPVAGDLYFQTIGTVIVAAGDSITLVLSGHGDGDIVADAARFAPVVPPVGDPTVGDAGFEELSAAAHGVLYDPSGSPWNFSATQWEAANIAGVATNTTGYTVTNPPAPQGSQVAFLQGTGSITQVVPGWVASSYTISLRAAQRAATWHYPAESHQDVRVLVDGVAVATIVPSSTSYELYTTGSFAVEEGAHTIAIAGLNTAGGDNTVLIDEVAITRVSSEIVLNTGVAGGVDYSGGFVFVAATFQDDNEVAAYLAAHPVVASPTFDATFTPVVVGENGQYPLVDDGWGSNDANSSWIAPNSHGQSSTSLAPFVNTAGGWNPAVSGPQGLYYYTTTFTVSPGSRPHFEGGSWLTDNQGVAIFLNGVVQAPAGETQPPGMTPFQIDDGDFVVGLNELTFVIFNEEFAAGRISPTGIRVEGSINLDGAAEPDAGPRSLSGRVYADANDNGRVDSGEPGLSGVTVALSGIDAGGAKVGASTVTRTDGSYSFAGLGPGMYSLAKFGLPGSIDGKVTAGTRGGTVSTGMISNIVLGGGTDGQGYNFGEDRAPAFVTDAPDEVRYGNTYDYTPAATDPDDDTLHYSLLAGPIGASLDDATGRITWPTTISDLGSHAVSLRVDDGRGGSAEQAFTIHVVDVPNRAPIFTSTPVVDAYVGTAYAYQATAFDPDFDALTFSDVTTSPIISGGIASAAGLAGWTPTAADLGSHDVTLQVSDGRGGLTPQPFIIVVHPRKDYHPPIIVSTPVENYRLPSGPLGPKTVLHTTIRDFVADGVTFEGGISGLTTGLVKSLLGIDGTPDFQMSPGGGSIANAANFYHDVPGVNQKIPYPILLQETAPGSGIYEFQEDSFFPIDGQGFNTGISGSNFYFTLEAHSRFTYRGGETLKFTGDDDVWVFLNGHLAIDLGGVHPPESGEVSLDEVARSFGMAVGGSYTFDIFYNERHTYGSTFHLQTGLLLDGSTPYRYDVRAISPENAPIKYSIVPGTGAPGMTIDEDTGVLIWEPNSSVSAQTYSVTVRADDIIGGGYDLQTYPLTAHSASGNSTPNFISPAPPNRVNQGETYEYQAVAIDPDGDPITYSLASGPQGMHIDRYTGRLTWTPNRADLGTSPLVSIIAGDGHEIALLPAFHIDAVQLTNAQPVIAAIVPQMVVLPAQWDDPWELETTATDADGDTLTYYLPGAPAGMVVNQKTGLISWEPNADQIGSYEAYLMVVDGHGGIDVASFFVTVTRPNARPIITSAPGAAVAGVAYSSRIAATDADGDAIAFRLYDEDGVEMVDQGGLRVVGDHLTWANPVIVSGGYRLRLVVEDIRGALSDPFDFTLQVKPNTSVTSPTIDPNYRARIQLGGAYYYQVLATDPAGYPLTYSLNWANVDPDIDPADLSITPGGLVSWVPRDLKQGYYFTVLASNGLSAPASQAVVVDVVSEAVVNHDPTITTTVLTGATANRNYRFSLKGDDHDHDPLEWALDAKQDGMVLDPSSGLLTWTPRVDQIGDGSLTVRVRDGQGGQAIKTFSIAVRGTNLPPQFQPVMPPAPVVGVSYSYQVQADDPEGGPLTFLELMPTATLPSGLGISPSGVISWANPAAGSYMVTVRVRDDQGDISSQGYTLTVAAQAPVPPPSISSANIPRQAFLDGLYRFDVEVTPGGNPVTLSLAGPIGDMAINGGVFTWTPRSTDGLGSLPATARVTIVATDSVTGAKGTLSFVITVKAANQLLPAPIVAPIPLQAATIGAAFSYNAQVASSHEAPLTWTLTGNVPAGLGIDRATGRITWEHATANPGTIQVVATDPYGRSDSESLTFTVADDTIAPSVRVESYPASPVAVGTRVTFVVVDSDNVGVVARTLKVNGIFVTLDSHNSYTMVVNQPGPVTLVATATDANGLIGTSAPATLQVFAPSTSAPIATLTSLSDPRTSTVTAFVDQVEITAPMDIIGSVGTAPLGAGPVSYTLEAIPLDGGPIIPIKSMASASLSGQVLGRFDPTMLANGAYLIRLTSNDGTFTTPAERIVNVAGRLKLGNLHLSFVDLAVPVAGIPITITRSYDTLNAHRDGDFGHGWTLDEGDFQIKVSQPGGPLEPLNVHARFVAGTRVVLTRPGMEPQGFTFVPLLKPSSLYTSSQYYKPWFIPDAGVTDKLTVRDSDNDFLISNGDGTYSSILDLNTYYNPADSLFGNAYTLTTRQGLAYAIDAGTGELSTITDRNGNTLTYDDTGIYSTTGRQVTFERDSNNRITALVDPRGNRITYEYDPATGDLIAVNNRQSNRAHALGAALTPTRLFYRSDRPHFLDSIQDPTGRTVAQASYDATTGRLSGLADALGVSTTLAYELDTLSTSITPPSIDGVPGQASTLTFDERGNPVAAVDALGHASSATFDGMDLTSQTQVVDGQAQTSTYEYDDDGNVKAVTDPQGHKTYYTYNDFGQPTSITSAAGTTMIGYDEFGNTTSTTSPGGLTTSYMYSNTGRVLTATTPNGTTTYTYNTFGDVLTVTDARDITTTYEYDDNGNQTKSSWTWHQPGNPSVSVAMVTTNVHDAEDRLVRTIGPDGSISDIAYDANGRAAWATDPHLLGQDATGTRTLYDAAGRVIRTEQFHDVEITVTVDPVTKVASSTYVSHGATISTSSTIYDARGQVTWSDDPHRPGEVANGTHTTYDANGQVLTTERRAGVVITVTELPDGSWTSALATGGSGTLLSSSGATYDDAGRVATTTDAANHVVTYAYDDSGRPTTVTDTARVRDANGDYTTTQRQTTSVYDAAGRLFSTTDALGHLTRYEYDADGRQVRTIFADRSSVRTSYDPTTGRKLSQTDATGNTTTYAYDEFGALTDVYLPKVVDPAHPNDPPVAPHYHYSYDTYGNFTSQTDPLGHTTSFTHDAFGRKLSETLPAVGGVAATQTWTYDAIGRLDYATNFNGEIVAYTYDDLDRVATKKTYASLALKGTGTAAKIVTYGYDGYDVATGRRFDTVNVADTAAYNANGTTTSYYDADGRLVAVQSPEGIVSYEYDAATGQKTRTYTGPSASPTTDILYTYDPNGRLQTVTAVKLDGTTTSQVTTYAYDLGDNLVATFLPNGTVEYRGYDPLNRMTSIETVRTDTNSNTTWVISGFTYTLDDAGRRVSIAEDENLTVATPAVDAMGRVTLVIQGREFSYNRNIDYRYDAAGRLIGEITAIGDGSVIPTATTTYTYDLAGNRVRVTSDGDGGDPSVAYTYDARDRLTSDSGSSGGSIEHTYTYDAAGNTRTVTTTNVWYGTQSVTVYTWDIEGRMVGADVPGAAGVIRHTDYAYDDGGIRVSSETDGEETTYLVDSNQAYDQVLEEYAEDGVLAATYVRGHDLLFQDRSGVRSFYAKDGLGSVRALTDSSGHVTDTASFDAYGNRTSWSGSTVNTYQFAGEWRDAATGLDYLRARYYDASAGRFTSRDSYDGRTVDPITLNHYAYANADPVNNIDPTGHFSIGSLSVSIAIGTGVLAGLTAGYYSGLVPAPSSRPGFKESLIPFWGAGKSYLYNLDNGNFLSAALDGAFFATDFSLARSIFSGIAQVGWKSVFRPGTMRLMFGEHAWDGSFHAAWQIGDNLYSALGSTGGRSWVVRVVKQPLKVLSESAPFTSFVEKLGFPIPVISQGLGQICTREADCITAMIRAANRANFGVFERIFKAAVIQVEGLTGSDADKVNKAE